MTGCMKFLAGKGMTLDYEYAGMSIHCGGIGPTIKPSLPTTQCWGFERGQEQVGQARVSLIWCFVCRALQVVPAVQG